MVYFTEKRIGKHTRSITDITDVHCFLVEGNDKAVLIDTGTGTGDIYSYVHHMTDKPIEVILTHGHCDHAGGAAKFDRVYLSEEDWDLVKHHASESMRMAYVKDNLNTAGKTDELIQFSKADIVPSRNKPYIPLNDGQIFDLGGVVLKAISVPGHTHGMTCILNITDRSILFGDACNTMVFLWGEESTTVAEYENSLQKLQKHKNEYDIVYLSHGDEIAPKGLLENVISVCDDLLNGKTDSQPYQFMTWKVKIAKKTNPDFSRMDGKFGNIVYVDEKLK